MGANETNKIYFYNTIFAKVSTNIRYKILRITFRYLLVDINSRYLRVYSILYLSIEYPVAYSGYPCHSPHKHDAAEPCTVYMTMHSLGDCQAEKSIHQR